MAGIAAQDPTPPMEVFVEFLDAIHRKISSREQVVPVLRGSMLMKHWFGDAARPVADLDLEWFPSPDWGGRFASPLEHARLLCGDSVDGHRDSPIVFDTTAPIPSDGVSLWDYDTPGIRCYTGWTWHERRLSGLLQVDLALAGSYDLASVDVETIELPRSWGEPARFLAYTAEMLLAAKLSWILRHLRRDLRRYGADVLVFSGEPKDLFDAHLLLTIEPLRPEAFQDAFLSVAAEDRLDWRQMDILLDVDLPLSEDDWSQGWPSFFARHRTLLQAPPREMLQTVKEGVRSLLGQLRDHLPFLQSISADPIDEVAYQIYADWLEDRLDSRADFVRQFCRFYFHADRSARDSLASTLAAQPGGWLHHLFGGSKRCRDIHRQVANLPSIQGIQDRRVQENLRDTSRSFGTATLDGPVDSVSANPKPWWRFW